MNNLSLPEVTENLDQLIDQITETHQPVIIKGTKNEVIMISSEDWSAIEETIYLNSISGYVDSIKEVIESPREEWVNAKDLGL
ncbi:type II toxin-antitoxin system Phd/YefM family antitoxin [Cyanobacterium aponinum UTEX 3222]|uniref:type II toxin-antitoxin system Phd/YefM family antitoxin n=1 Tax=Cyanobacterium aponinum TaxID=379064 RepID=UPI00308E5AD8|nr:type II toxin-antitoxin system Phd/YefM family antitoxin [Cyanobacterium aponinum UTEX 3222]